MPSYKEVYETWRQDPEAFWMAAAEEVDWIRKPTRALDDSEAPFYRWFADGSCNTCWNAVDRHVASGRGEQTAIIHDSPISGRQTKITYQALQSQVARLAGALAARGVVKGDRVIVYMPMVPEALVAMLACARIGAVHSVVFGGFAAHELAVRIDDATPKAILAGSCGLEPGRTVAYKPLLDAAIDQAKHKPDFCIILQRPQLAAGMIEGRDLDWQEAVAAAEEVDCVPVGGADPLYILYTSGTTGQPKGVVRHNGGHMVALIWSMKYLYGVGPGEVYWAASDVGWVVGHSYICYAPLLMGCTTVVFEGKPVGTPDAGVFWRMIEEHGISVLFTAPTALRAIKRDDPEGACIKQYDLSAMKALFLAGERADPDTVLWCQTHLEKPVIDHWWQTETGWSIAANPLGIETLPIKPGSPAVPMPGYQIAILDESGQPLPPDTLGAIAIKLPLPPGSLPTLWNAAERFKSSYLAHFPGYYETGDAGLLDQDGYVSIMARTDDVINVAGHRLSTGAIEEVLAAHPDVAECAVIGISDSLKGQAPLGLVCLNKGCERPQEEIAKECIGLVRKEIGPVAAFKLCVAVERLPKTRSGKILRGTMVSIADGKSYKMPATIDDPAILDEIAEKIAGMGQPGS
ncbi:MAG: propionyl-CoA synthetase [Rhodospirillales bacterium]|nr:propionyl-CoA synthetase [Rhodospirillales bacterium]